MSACCRWHHLSGLTAWLHQSTTWSKAALTLPTAVRFHQQVFGHHAVVTHADHADCTGHPTSHVRKTRVPYMRQPTIWAACLILLVQNAAQQHMIGRTLCRRCILLCIAYIFQSQACWRQFMACCGIWQEGTMHYCCRKRCVELLQKCACRLWAAGMLAGHACRQSACSPARSCRQCCAYVSWLQRHPAHRAGCSHQGM
jgi:hypothetical protein